LYHDGFGSVLYPAILISPQTPALYNINIITTDIRGAIKKVLGCSE